jgi:hypothetical protein
MGLAMSKAPSRLRDPIPTGSTTMTMAPAANRGLITFPAHALLILEERLAEQEAEGVEMPEGMERDELALMILLAAELSRLRSE